MADPKYRVRTEFFYQDRMLKAGYAGEDGNGFVFTGEPGDNLEPMNDEAKQRVADAEARRKAKRDALVTAEGAGANAELLALVREISATNLALEQRVRDLEAKSGTSLPTDALATKAGLEALAGRVDNLEVTAVKLREDVDEHDQGLTLHEQRIVEVEGIINRPPVAPAAPTDPGASPSPPETPPGRPTDGG